MFVPQIMCLILDTSMTVITYSGKSVDADQLTSLKPADLYLHGFKKQDIPRLSILHLVVCKH